MTAYSCPNCHSITIGHYIGNIKIFYTCFNCGYKWEKLIDEDQESITSDQKTDNMFREGLKLCSRSLKSIVSSLKMKI